MGEILRELQPLAAVEGTRGLGSYKGYDILKKTPRRNRKIKTANPATEEKA